MAPSRASEVTLYTFIVQLHRMRSAAMHGSEPLNFYKSASRRLFLTYVIKQGQFSYKLQPPAGRRSTANHLAAQFIMHRGYAPHVMYRCSQGVTIA